MIKFGAEIEFIGQQKEMFDYIKELRIMHDKDYALKLKVDAIEKEYQKMIMTDVWYEASKAWVDKIIENYDWDSIYYVGSARFMDGLSGVGTYVMVSDDGGDSNNWVKIESFAHNADIEVTTHEFERFCIKYKNEKEDNSNI